LRQNTGKGKSRGKRYEKGGKIEEKRKRDREKVQEQKVGTWKK